MIAQRLVVTYLDGETDNVLITQADLSEFELWALREGIVAPKGMQIAAAAPMTFLRFGAWSALRRDGASVGTYKAWTNTVDRIEPQATDPVDPTEPATPDERSPSSL